MGRGVVAERESIEQGPVGIVSTGATLFVLKMYPQIYPQIKF